MNIPTSLIAGDSASWKDAQASIDGGVLVSSPTWALTYYLRTNTASEGATVTGAADGAGGWDFSIAAATTAAFDAGRWYWQAQASNAGALATLAAGTLDVTASLAYTGTPVALDGRSQSEKDLEAVQTAIRSLIAGGVSQYAIGSRQATKLDLGKLVQRESYLKGIVARERAASKAAAGLGDPRNLFVRFGS